MHEQLAGHAAAEDGVGHLHGGKPAVPVGDGGGKAHAQLALGNVLGLGFVAGLAGAVRGLRRQRGDLAPDVLPQGRDQRGNLFRLRRAHIEDLHRALGQHRLIMPVQLLMIQGLHLLGLTQAGDAEAVVLAHHFQQPGGGIGPLVAALGFNGGDQIALLAFHKFPVEAAVLHNGIQQQLTQEMDHRGQDPVSLQGKPILHKATVKAGGLIVADAAHQGAHAGTVQIVQPLGDAADIRVFPAAPQQNGRQQRIIGGFRRIHPAQELDAQRTLLEPAVPDAAQGHTGHNL